MPKMASNSRVGREAWVRSSLRPSGLQTRGRISLCCFEPLLCGCYYCSPRTMVFQAETTPDLRSPRPHLTPRPQAQTSDTWGPCSSQAWVRSVPLWWRFLDPPVCFWLPL